MTTRYTNEEWTSIIADIEQEVLSLDATSSTYSKNNNDRIYPIPAIGSKEFARTIDHTLLKLEATSMQIDGLCNEARISEFATVCVRPNYVAQAVADLKGSQVHVASVIGFHEGTYDLSHKLRETSLALSAGAHELDVVLNHPLLHTTHSYNTIYNELAALRSAAPPPTILKLIFEVSQLSTHQVIAASVLAGYASFDFVKTSTGFCGRGAEVGDVRVMRSVCEVLRRRKVGMRDDSGRGMRVKASGGIRTLSDARAMLEAGAERLGTSGGVWIVKEGRELVEGIGDGGDCGGSGGRARAGTGNRPGLATRLFTDY